MSNLCVPDLVHKLCEGLLKDSKNCNYNSSEINHYKKMAFEILLKKTNKVILKQAENLNTDELEFTKFELKLNAKSDEERNEIEESIKTFTDLLEANKELLNDITSLLVKLKDCCQDVRVKPKAVIIMMEIYFNLFLGIQSILYFP